MANLRKFHRFLPQWRPEELVNGACRLGHEKVVGDEGGEAVAFEAPGSGRAGGAKQCQCRGDSDECRQET